MHRKGATTWGVVVADLPCFLDASGHQLDPTLSETAQQRLDRTGTLFTLPAADVLPGDRVVLTRGAVGTFLVRQDPANVATLQGPSHAEHRVEEVPS